MQERRYARLPSWRGGNRGNAALLRATFTSSFFIVITGEGLAPQPVLCSRSQVEPRQKSCFWFSAIIVAAVNFAREWRVRRGSLLPRVELTSSTRARIHPRSGFRACKSMGISVHRKSLCKTLIRLSRSRTTAKICIGNTFSRDRRLVWIR